MKWIKEVFLFLCLLVCLGLAFYLWDVSGRPVGRCTARPETARDGVTTERCEPRRRVVFAKTHKTGSTSVQVGGGGAATLQNILHRAAEAAGLLVVLPRGRRHLFPLARPFHPDMAEAYGGKVASVPPALARRGSRCSRRTPCGTAPWWPGSSPPPSPSPSSGSPTCWPACTPVLQGACRRL